MKIRMPRRSFNFAWSFLLISLLLCAGTTALAQANGSRADSIASRVDKIFAQWDKKDSPGCALAVIKDGSIIYKRGYGMADLDHDIPISPTSVFHVASVSKQFTAMAIALLAQQGKLSLDDEVRKHVAEVPDFGVPITIRHLVHHTSGLRDQWSLLIMSGWRLGNDVVKEGDILELVSRQKELNFKPGDEYLYSNTGYTLMATIVERVSGKSLREFTAENIFKPLGMNSTQFRDDHSIIVKNQAYAYSTGSQGVRLSVPNYDTVGASSLLTTVEDLALWDQNFYNPRVGGEALIKQMQIPATLNGGEKITYAMGLAVSEYKGLKVVEHSGGDAGYRSHLMRFPDQKFSVACLCNSSNTNPGGLARQVADIYLYGQLKSQDDNKPAAMESNGVKLSKKQMEEVTGMYWNPVTEEVSRVAVNSDKLYVGGFGSSNELLPLGENRFQISGRSQEVKFESPQGGGAMKMVMSAAGRNPVVWTSVKSADPQPAQLAEYVGAYYSSELDSIYRLEFKDDKLILKRRKAADMQLRPTFKDAFISQAGNIRFIRDHLDRVVEMTITSGRIRRLRFVKQ